MAVAVKVSRTHIYERVRSYASSPYGVYGFLSLLVLLPLLAPGYILTLDMVFTPTIRLPEQVTASYPFYALLHYLNMLIPSEILEKTLLFTILLLSGLGMHRLVQAIQQAHTTDTGQKGVSSLAAHEYALWGAYIAGGLYMINPFTYSRFMAGQFAVLLGYALLPFFARTLLRFVMPPSRPDAFRLAGMTILIGIVSIHTIGLIVILAIAAVSLTCWRYRKQAAHLKRLGLDSLLSFTIAAIGSSYWLVPLLLGQNTTANAIDSFTAADQHAFATVGVGVIQKVINVLQLQGFWAEARGLYVLPAARFPLWGFAVLGLWAIVFIGARQLWKQQRLIAAVLGVGASVALLLAVSGAPNWLAGHINLFAGYREPHKFVGLVALFYGVCVGLAIPYILAWCKTRQKVALLHISSVCFILLPVMLAPTMFWGFGGQLQPRQYPEGWYAIDRHLQREAGRGKALFLPWHQYSHFDFAGRIIMSPADKFFSIPTVVSHDLEFSGASPTFPDAQKDRIGALLNRQGKSGQLGAELVRFDIQYVILAKEFDQRKYDYLNRQSDLILKTETDSLKLYQNLAYKEE